MHAFRAIFIVALFGPLLLTACQLGQTKKQATVKKVLPIEKTAPEIPASPAPKEAAPKKEADTQQTTETPDNKTIEKKDAPEKPIEIAVIVSYFRFLNSLPEKALKQEYTRTQKEFSQDQSPINRLRLAMLLGFTHTKHRDTQRSLDLLNGYMDDPNTHDPMLRDFSFLLSSFVQQFKAQDSNNKKISRQLKKERAENKKLKTMIEELKTIEKNLMKRETAEKQ